MNRSTYFLFFIFFCFSLLTACNLPISKAPSPELNTAQDTSLPPVAESTDTLPTQQAPVADTPAPVNTKEPANEVQIASLRLSVRTADQTIHLVELNSQPGSFFTPAFTGFLPQGGSANGISYALNFSSSPSMAVKNDQNGQQNVSFITNPNYGLAIWRGNETEQPRLAWGTMPVADSNPSSLQISNADGSQMTTLLTEDAGTNRPVQFVAEFWSADGQSLYYSEEPVGIGGYIIFAGASNLSRINIATREITTLIPQQTSMICLDAFSADYSLVADHCTPNQITVRDINNAGSTAILPPADVNGYAVLGSARFSPESKRIAYALAKADPSNEQGWLAIADIGSGVSQLIYTGQSGGSITVDGWLDAQTLLIETTPTQCVDTCENQIWTINLDGSNLTKVADGNFITLQTVP